MKPGVDDTTANPAAAAVAFEPSKAERPAVLDANCRDIESALAGLQDKTLTPAQAAVAIVHHMQQLKAEMRDDLRAELAAATPSAERTIKGVVARLTNAPTSFHQGTVFFAGSEEQALKDIAPAAMFGSMLMCLIQCATAVGLIAGTGPNSCFSSAQCRDGTFCMVDGNNRCWACSGFPKQLQDGELLTVEELRAVEAAQGDSWHFNLTSFISKVCISPTDSYRTNAANAKVTLHAASVMSWCETCVHPIDNTVSGTSEGVATLGAMGLFDKVALVFATTVVAITVVAELKDIELCNLSIARAGAHLSPGWRLGLTLLGGLRRWAFLPALVMTVPQLVLKLGGDALSVCFNSVAVLFICEIDNIVYAVGLGERIRTRIEEEAHMELDSQQMSNMARTKAVHATLIVLFIVCEVLVAEGLDNGVLAVVAFWTGGIAEVLADPATTPMETAKRMGRVTMACLGGFCVAGGMLALAFIS